MITMTIDEFWEVTNRLLAQAEPGGGIFTVSVNYRPSHSFKSIKEASDFIYLTVGRTIIPSGELELNVLYTEGNDTFEIKRDTPTTISTEA